MRNKKLVVLVGRIGSGKTTLANWLVANYSYTKVSFADPIRRMFEGLGLTKFDLQEGKNTPHELLSGKTPRQAMQTLGTEWARDLMDKNFWVNIWKRNVNINLFNKFGSVVTDDCRFTNEGIMAFEQNATIIRIKRDSATIDGHASEAQIDGIECEFEIDNNGTIEEAQDKLIKIIRG